MTCSFVGCPKPSRGGSITLCSGHYTQQVRGKDLRPLRVAARPSPPPVFVERDGQLVKVCVVTGCPKPPRTSLCRMHQARFERHGDTDACTPQVARALPRGADHWAWSDDPGYYAMHQRLTRWLGRAAERACACGQPAAHWAYIGPRQPGERLPHSSDPSAYQAMCVSCHKQADVDAIAAADRGQEVTA